MQAAVAPGTAGALDATVIAAFGRSCIAQLDSGENLPCLLSGKQMHPVCGDRVSVRKAGNAQGHILAVAPRRNLYSRSSGARTKLIAANLSQVVAIAACEPSIDDELLCRFLIAAENAGVGAAIALNKTDLLEKLPAARRLLDPFRLQGYPVLEFSAKQDIAPLLRALRGHRTLLVGQSGMGKSTIVKRLVPDAEVRIAEISRRLGTGKQTTSSSRMYAIAPDVELIDSPGVSQFGLAGMDTAGIQRGFPEFLPYAGNCRFSDCRHLAEPDCAVRAAGESGSVHPRRLALYQHILRTDVLDRK